MRLCLWGNYCILTSQAYDDSVIDIDLKRKVGVVHFESDGVFCYHSSTNRPTYNASCRKWPICRAHSCNLCSTNSITLHESWCGSERARDGSRQGLAAGNPCVRQLIILFGVDITVDLSHHCCMYANKTKCAMRYQPSQSIVQIWVAFDNVEANTSTSAIQTLRLASSDP